MKVPQLFARFYPNQCTLIDYLAEVQDKIYHPNDQSNYKDLLEKTIVCYHGDRPANIALNVMHGFGIEEVIQRIIKTSCHSKGGSTSNVLSLGYEVARDKPNSQATNSIFNEHPNSNVRFLMSKVWQTLYDRVGDDLMIHLLKDVALFVKVGTSCYMQVSGQPMYNLEYMEVNQRAKPRNTSHNSKSKQGSEACKEHPSSIHESDYSSVRLLGENASKEPSEQCTLPSRGISNILDTEGSYHSQGTLCHGESQTLPVFQSAAQGKDVCVKMEVDEKLAFQENESKKKTSKKRKRNTSSSRTRKPAKKRRLNDSTFKASSNPELQSSPSEHKSRVVNRHFFRQSIMYSTNLKDKFPKKHIMETTAANSSGVTRLIRAIFIDDDIHEKDNNKKKGLPKKKKPKIQRLPRRYLNMRELFKTFLLRHKRCKFADLLKRYCKVTRNGSSIHEQQMSPSLFDEDEPDKEVEEYKTAVNNYTKTYNVCRFVKAVCDTVIPAEFWGTDANKRAFYKSLQRFIMMQKDETFSLLQMGHKIKVKSCDWLKLTRNKGGRIPVTESEKQKEVFYRWLWWLVRNYIMVILKAFFYITEGASQSQDIFYYRKPTWRTIQSFGIKTVTTTMLSEISEKEAKALVESKASLGYSRMRFLPKASSVRPIVNMKVSPKISGAKVNLSINSKLRNVFEIMRFENARKPARSDSTMFGVDDVYKRIKSFVATRENHDEPLYFVHVDINKCFDSILLDRLFHIMKAVFKEEEYSIRRFAMIKSCQGKVKKVFEKSVALGNDCRTFKEFAEDTIKEKGFRNMILIDQVYYPRLDLQQVLATLKKHLFGNIVMIGSNFYRQNRGIAQGSILSTYLCSHFYNHMEKRYLKTFTKDDSSLLMRWVDDFLFMTPTQAKADAFLSTMHAGIPKYGCQISAKKTLVNFNTTTGIPVRCISQDQGFPWCGFLFHSKMLDVGLDYSRYQDVNPRKIFPKTRQCNNSQVLLSKLSFSARNKCHPLLLDLQINSQDTVQKNLYEMFYWLACKFYLLCRNCPQDIVVLKLSRLICSFTKRKFRKLNSKERGSLIKEGEIKWVFYQAFTRCLKRKHLFKDIVKTLRKLSGKLLANKPNRPKLDYRNPLSV